MNYFVTGATGFIGKRLVDKLLARPDSVVYLLVHPVELSRLNEFREYWRGNKTRAISIIGELAEFSFDITICLKKWIGFTYEHT